MTLALDPQGYPCDGGRPLDLPPKERAVLALLIEKRPQVVSKQAFADAAWGGRAMSDESLARCISRLRRALPQHTIEALYGTGYRLAGEAAPNARLASAMQAPPQVVDAYLHARRLAHQRTPVASERAIALLRTLIRQHPGYASAHVALAEALAGAASWGLPSEAGFIEEAFAQLAEAERIDAACPGLVSARAYLFDFAWRFDEAEAAYDAAARVQGADPDTAFLRGFHALLIGDPACAVERLQRALVLQPHSALVRITLARALSHLGEHADALHEARVTCDEHPDSLIALTFRWGLQAWYHRGDEAAVQALRPLARHHDAAPVTLSTLGYALAAADHHDEARTLIESCLIGAAHSPSIGALHAAALALLGERERAVALVQQAAEARSALLPMVLRDPALVPLLAHPAVRAVAARVFVGRCVRGLAPTA